MVLVLVLTGALPDHGAVAWAQLWVLVVELQEDRCCSAYSRVSVGQVHDGSCSQVIGQTGSVPAVPQQPAGGARGPAGPDPGVPGSEARGPESQPQPAARPRTRLVLWVLQSGPGWSANPGLLLQTHTVPGNSEAPPPSPSPVHMATVSSGLGGALCCVYLYPPLDPMVLLLNNIHDYNWIPNCQYDSAAIFSWWPFEVLQPEIP